jgi:Transglycosylase SLT domain
VFRGARLAVLVFLLAAGGALSLLAVTGDDDPPAFGPVTVDPGEPDPFAYGSDREDEFVERATAGHSHVLYEKSPGGVLATARRVERWRGEIEEQAESAGVDPDLLEAIVFLESAGNPHARASDDLEGAVGLTQILAETATSLLGMRVDVEESERLTRRMQRRGPSQRLLARRRAIDQRFDPAAALRGAGRYLQIAEDRFGSEELAVVSYHMGIGNLESVLERYGETDVSWAQVYFDATPRNHPSAYRLLSGFGDDSATYLWRVYAAREIMRLHREDQGELRRLARLQTAASSAELVLHPPGDTEIFETREELEDAYRSGELRPFEGVRGMRPAARLPSVHRGLRPEAYELAVYLAAGVHDVGRTRAPLTVTSTVREAEAGFYSLDATGFAFDVGRDYASDAQAVAFEYVLDRLQSLNLIAWVREPDVIHITAASEAGELVP